MDEAPTCQYVFCGVRVSNHGDFCSPECRMKANDEDAEDNIQVVKDYEHVNHPKHYNDHPSGVECIDIIEHMPFNIGTAMKYLWRAGLKPGEGTDQDLKKAIWYIERQRTIDGRVKR